MSGGVRFIFLLAAVWIAAQASSAGVYTDELSKCMVESTTATDRIALARGMFAAAAAHPAVKPLSAVSPQQLSDASKTMGELLTRLLIQDCSESAKKAFKYEGALAFQTSMQLLGQVAGQELFASPEVTSALSDLDASFDREKLQAMLEGE